MGERVRFDGGHKLDTLITETLGRYFEWVPVCPEIEIGLGAPRESMRLTGSADSPRLIAVKSGKDYTEAMSSWAEKRLEGFGDLNLQGYILKKDSPSCGMERVRIYGRGGTAQRDGTGIFAGMLREKFDMLPIEEEGRLRDARIRENFIERVFALHRWQEFKKSKPGPGALVRFHTALKLTLSSHSDAHYRRLGRLTAAAGRRLTGSVIDEYGRLLMEALRVPATPRKHSNVLLHILGFLKRDLDAGDKAELIGCINEYRRGLVPLAVPMTLLKHHLRRRPVPWVEEQVYLNPYPPELMLRSQV